MSELNAIQLPALPVAFTAVAFLYSSVEHNEATGDLATAALSGLPPAEPTPGAWLPGALGCKPLEHPFCGADQPCLYYQKTPPRSIGRLSPKDF